MTIKIKEILTISLYHKIAYLLAIFSFGILGIYGYTMSSIFPYSVLTGVVLLITSLVINPNVV